MVGITITVGPIVIVVCNEIVVEIAMVPAPSDDVCICVGIDDRTAPAPCWVIAVGFFCFPPTAPPTAAAMATTRATTTITMIPFRVR